jgi:hypothetical protein
MTDALSEGRALTASLDGLEVWLGVGGVAHQGAPTVAELEAQGFRKVVQSWRYGTWLMVRREHETQDLSGVV